MSASAPPDSGGPLAAGRRLGRYEILGKLAAGGMAVVYVARAHGAAGFERLVAVKVLHANLAHEEEFIRMFVDEARLAARIRHPNVVPTTDISDTAEAGYFLVMDYIDGDHLGALLSGAHKAGERLPVPVVLRILVDALAGLGAAHDLVDDKGRPFHLVHRDVSPHNIMVGRDGVTRLTDFGVAKAEDRLTHTRDGQVKGKLAYMAPEQAAYGTADKRSDLFSMGIILWECLTGRRLFRAGSTAQTLNKLLHDEVPPPSSVHAELAPIDAVLKRALDRDAERRFQSADELAQAIEETASSLGGLASLREVSKAVVKYAAARLRRDKKLIDEAVIAIRRRDSGLPDASRPVSEPSGPLSGDTSQPSGELSVSKASGVFSYATSGGAKPKLAAGPPLAAPPPVGAVLGDLTDSEFPDELRPKWPARFMWVAGVCLVAAMAWYLTVAQKQQERPAEVIEIGPVTAPSSAPSAPAVESPALAAPSPTAPAEALPTAAADAPPTAAAPPSPSAGTTRETAVGSPSTAGETRATRPARRPAASSRASAPTAADEAPAPAADAAKTPTPAKKPPSSVAPPAELFSNPYKK